MDSFFFFSEDTGGKRGGAGGAGRLIQEMRSGAEAELDPKELEEKQLVRLHQLLHEAKFKDPDSSHLSPAGSAPFPFLCPSCLTSKSR